MKKLHLIGLFALISLQFISSCSEKEKEITVQSIAISQPSAELVIGETLNLKATISPSNATYDGITWTSTKTSVATVSGSGQVSALAEGNTTITAMAGGKTASCSITVVKGYVAVSSISLNKDSIELIEGDSETLTATVSPNDATDKTVSWSSSNDAVATVKDGAITAIKEGEATISAKAGEKTASCKVVVAKKAIPVESIELNKTSVSLRVGETFTLSATVKPDNATEKTITWISLDERIATVKDGVVSAIEIGLTSIIAKAGEKEALCVIAVDDGTINGYEYVDLGLPSGLKWATCNIGANNPEETGDFYAWGDVEVYYTGKVYKFYKEEKGLDSDGFEYVYKGYTKYITKDKADQYGFKGFYDNKARLDMEDDVAYIKLGGTWRMPGMGDYKELLDTTNCLWEYVTYRGVKGYKVTSKRTGYTDKWIFFPHGGCWSTSLNTGIQSEAWAFAFNSSFPYITVVSRQVGEHIRAVSE